MLSHFYYHWLPNYFVIEILSYFEAQATTHISQHGNKIQSDGLVE